MTSASSTPNRRGTTAVENATLENVYPRIREDLEGKYRSDVKFLDFVTDIWHIDVALAEHILAQPWTLLPEPLETYGKVKYEPKMYAPFAQMADNLLSEVTKVACKFLGKPAPVPGMENLISFWNNHGKEYLESPLTDRKPDMLTLKKGELTPLWSIVRSIIEFKRDSAQQEKAKSKVSSKRSKKGESQLRSSTLRKSTPRVHSSTNTSSAIRSSHKRRYVDSEDSDDSDAEHCAKRRCVVPQVTKEHLQLAIYALECLDASSRRFVTGLWIDQYQVSLWYFDRACVIQTETFNFLQNPEKLALVLYALGTCDDAQLGFDPSLALPPSGSLVERPATECPRNWQDVIGYEFRFPLSGTRLPRQPNDAFRIEQTVFGYRGLIGRGTMVYKVVHVADPATPRALKLGWPLVCRKLEAETIQRLRERLPPALHAHLPKVVRFGALTAEQMGLPRHKLLQNFPIDKFEDRLLHALVMKFYGKLWHAGSVENFQEIFVDCVECHYHAFMEGRVLHRDLSENNLMFDRTEDDIVKGILNDWDMASYVDDNDEIQLSTATHRTGTVPFMARDLLVTENPPPHLYRHDLESFFYILVWAALHYDFTKKKRSRVKEVVEAWNDNMFRNAQNAKGVFFLDKGSRDFVLERVKSGSISLLPWIHSLWTIFNQGIAAVNSGGDKKTMGGLVTFETFMKALGREPRFKVTPEAPSN
ncbi:hypothetical protein H0H81_011902 [Sphagnurus paluster]|uniref:Fungal-type protein kinase domain-containing protein n=1 Tax=Sphagnurus paluster TaxID=117069 RepID=A0A9P7FWP3_9AGAR|nr:hypothetical protein H0H81_011902 [Sphagnurus paluster]